MKWLCAATAAFALVVAMSAQAGAAQSKPRLDVYTGVVGIDQLGAIRALGVDRHELDISAVRGAKDTVRVETIITGAQAAELRRDGVELAPKEIDGKTVAERATLMAADGHEVFRKYSGAGGLKEEFEEIADDNRRIAKLVSIGETHPRRGHRRAEALRGRAQQARRPQALGALPRRAARARVDHAGDDPAARALLRRRYSRDRDIRELLEDNELWFIPVANPDGYDHSFNPNQRLWRKNLRDNNGNGQLNPGEGVDLNRNYPYKWGYDNEGSSPDPSSDTYRGPTPGSEPETQALDRFVDRIDFTFLVNYHSAAQLLLYGTGWQVSTPTPDDTISIAMAGDDEEPAVPGYDPDISAELYTTNGDTDTHMTEEYDTLGFTPEMSTCEAASDSVPNDEWEAEDCGSGFEFPDDEELVQAEFENNIPFALSVAESAEDPDDPESAVDREAPNFVVDSFDVSYGDPQTVAVVAKRSLDDLRMHYRIDGGRTRTTSVREWRGGERYGDENDHYYAEYRGVVRGADEGDDVRVWFTAEEDRRGRGRDDDVSSERFTYTVASDSRADVLVLASEDYTGVNPTYDPPLSEAEVRRRARRGARAGRLRRGRLGHRRAGRPARPRRVQPLRRDRVGAGREPAHAGSGGRVHLGAGGHLRRAGAPGHRGRRARAVHDDGRARLPQRGRQADPRRRDGAVLRPDRGRRRRPLLRAQRRSGGGVRHHVGPGPVRGLPVPGGRLPPVLPRRVDPRGGRRSRQRRRRRRAARGLQGDLGGGHELDEAGAFQPTSDVLPADEFPQFPARRRPTTPRAATRSLRPRAATTRRAACGRVVHAAVQDGHGAGGRDRGAAAVPAVVQHRAVVRQRHRRGADRRPGRLDDAAGPQRRHADRSAGRVRARRVPARRCTRS